MTALLGRLRLSIAELDFLARAGDLAAFPGLPPDVADPSADGIVLDGLRAHGVIEGESDELELREDVATLLGAILECDVSLELEAATGEHAVSTVVHLHDELAILQRVDDGLVSLVVVLPDDLPSVLLSLCGEDPAAEIGEAGEAVSVRLTRDALARAERGEDDAPPAPLAGYIVSATAPERAGRAAARDTLYGEPRAACAWVAGPGGTYVVYDRGQDAEIVRADGRALAEQLLSLARSPS